MQSKSVPKIFSQEKKLVCRVKAIANDQGMSFTESIRLAMEKFIAEYEDAQKKRSHKK